MKCKLKNKYIITHPHLIIGSDRSYFRCSCQKQKHIYVGIQCLATRGGGRENVNVMF